MLASVLLLPLCVCFGKDIFFSSTGPYIVYHTVCKIQQIRPLSFWISKVWLNSLIWFPVVCPFFLWRKSMRLLPECTLLLLVSLYGLLEKLFQWRTACSHSLIMFYLGMSTLLCTFYLRQGFPTLSPQSYWPQIVCRMMLWVGVYHFDISYNHWFCRMSMMVPRIDSFVSIFYIYHESHVPMYWVQLL